jgi:hypothetical protein
MIGQTSKIASNEFGGALNSDLANAFQSDKQYIAAKNVTLIANNEFLSLQNLAGTTNVTDIIAPSGTSTNEVLGVFNAHLTVNGNRHRSLIIFITDYTNFKIFGYDIEASQLYEMFSQSVDSDYDNSSRVVDAALYPENNIDYIYFTDNHHEYRKLKCEIPDPYVPSFLTTHDLKVIRPFPLGILSLTDIKEGGSLLCGSYQFAYQLYNPTKNKYTKFSLLTNPIQIFANQDEFVINGGIGVLSPYQIVLSATLSEHEKDLYTHFRFAVVENVYPEIEPLEALLTNFYALSDYDAGDGNISNYSYASNIKGEKILISELVVETSPIDTIKTIAVKENRLFGGGITYKDLEYNSGTPYFNGGEILRQTGDTGNPFTDQIFASRYKGYFRGEVYRFAISYFDEDGNFSVPQVLDCSSIEANDYSSSVTTQNVISNGDFSAGFTGWTQLTQQTGDADWLNIDPGTVSYNLNTSSNSKILYQTIPAGVGPSGTVTFNWEFHPTPGVSNATFMVQIFFLSGGSVINYSPQYMAVNSMSGVFNRSITLPSGTTQIGIRITHFAPGPSDWGGTPPYFRIDNLAFVTNVPLVGGGDGGGTGVFTLDMKFPNRDVAGYGLWSSDGKLQSLGVRFTDIQNHPTWAKGFVILRAERLKNIITQTPLIPMVPVHGTGAVQNYPTKVYDKSGHVEYPEAQPMGPNVNYVPKNFLWSETRGIVKNTTIDESNLLPYLRTYEGEAKYKYLNKADNFMLFPPAQMYNPNAPFEPLNGLSIRAVDAVALQAYISDLAQSVLPDGNRTDTNVATTVFAVKSGDYFFDGNHNGSKTLTYATPKITDYTFFDNYNDGKTFVGLNVLTYNNLSTPGVVFGGLAANTQRCGVIHVDEKVTQLSRSLTFASSPTFYTETTTDNALSDTFVITGDGVAPNYVDVVPIVNIERGLADDRYGKITDKQEYIYTGTMVVFTEAELADVEAGAAVPKTVDVWGGDCIVSPHLFKITDTTYAVTNQKKFNSSYTYSDLSPDSLRSKWDRVFLSFGNNTVLSIPIALEGCAQYIQVVLESEYNGAVRDSDFFRPVVTVSSDSDIITYGINTDNTGYVRTPLHYQYNVNYVKQNNEKKFFTTDIVSTKNRFLRSRIHVSDQKIYQSNIEGFDMFRLLNYKDLEETYGGITKLITLKNNLYAFQEQAITYLSVGINILEQADGDTLSVKSNEVISNLILKENKKGSQHLRSVLSTGNEVLYVDNINKGIYLFDGESAVRISDRGIASNVRSLLNSTRPERTLVGVYDHDSGRYLIGDSSGDFVYSYLVPQQVWESDIDFGANSFQGGVYTNQKLYLVGEDAETSQIALHTFGTGPYTKIFGTYYTPSVRFIITPDAEISKVFDSMLINSTDRLGTLDLTVRRAVEFGNQIQAPVVDLSQIGTRGEGNYKLKTLRDSSNARLRGVNMTAMITWPSTVSAIPVSLNSVHTKYRFSEGIF